MNNEIIAPKFLLPYYYSWKINNTNTTFNVCFSYELNTKIDTQKLKESILQVVTKRPHLRANFKFNNNEIKYVVAIS